MEATLYDADGTDAGTAELPDVFETPYRPDLIRRAFLAAQANAKQDYGSDEHAGLRTSAESWGSGRGAAHVPRVKNGNDAARVPHVRGGRRAHPPQVAEDRTEGFNDKERRLAVESAVAATADADRVAERGHVVDDAEVPVVVSEDFEDLDRTKDVVAALEAIGVHGDVARADEGRNVRAGKGTTRGRTYRTPTSVLFVATEEILGARNLPGCDVVDAESVGVPHLAPGGDAGRLTVYTEPALEVLDDR
jgi:large subunit ribosomal protein L4e